MSERVAVFGSDRSLVGIVTDPPAGMSQQPFGVLILNAGLLHRIGPNRLHVKLARQLASLGFTVLRFDFSGVGDSHKSTSQARFEQRCIDEARSAMKFLEETALLRHFLVIGICSGAEASFLLAEQDPRVAGAVVINGAPVGELTNTAMREVNDRTQLRYYRTRLLSPRSWMRLLSGRSNLATIRRVLQRRLMESKSDASDSLSDCADRFSARTASTDARLLFVLSEGSAALDLLYWERQARLPHVQLSLVAECDHVFTPLSGQRELIDTVAAWALPEGAVEGK